MTVRVTFGLTTTKRIETSAKPSPDSGEHGEGDPLVITAVLKRGYGRAR